MHCEYCITPRHNLVDIYQIASYTTIHICPLCVDNLYRLPIYFDWEYALQMKTRLWPCTQYILKVSIDTCHKYSYLGDCIPVTLVCLTDMVTRRIYYGMNPGNRWLDLQDQHPAGAKIVPVIFASSKTQMTNFLGDEHAWPLYLEISYIQKDIRLSPKKHSCILVWRIHCPRKGD